MEKNSITKIKKILIVICVLLIISLVSYVLIANKVKEPTREEIIENTDKYITHTSYDDKFTIETPNTWKIVVDKNSLNKNAILELQNEEENAYLVVVINSKLDLNEDFNTYKTKVFKQKETFYKTTITSYTDVVINERQAQYGVIYYTNSNNINTYIRSYAFETENYYGQLVIWTLASNEENVQKEFDNIVKTLKEK
ncbi:MAG: hypothetical protein IJN90_02040 [Bacilli bacterium]|nr:hypothetical protein [Bacilli bacterium]